MTLQYTSTYEQVADILTKSLGSGKFVFFRDKLGVVQNTFLGKSECWFLYLGKYTPNDFCLSHLKGEINMTLAINDLRWVLIFTLVIKVTFWEI